MLTVASTCPDDAVRLVDAAVMLVDMLPDAAASYVAWFNM
jgi:hypothetical protein